MTPNTVPRYLLPLSEYNRVYQVAHGVLQDIASAEKACMFFACFGAYVLKKHYNIPARAVAGAFALCVSDIPEVVSYGKHTDGHVNSGPDGFHMWVQTQTHIIDFMAPIYQEAFSEVRSGISIPRRMFQRPITTEAASLSALTRPGDFIAWPNPQLTEERINTFLAKPSSGDLVEVANAWFGSRRKPQQRSFQMVNDLGAKYKLSLPSTIASGSW